MGRRVVAYGDGPGEDEIAGIDQEPLDHLRLAPAVDVGVELVVLESAPLRNLAVRALDVRMDLLGLDRSEVGRQVRVGAHAAVGGTRRDDAHDPIQRAGWRLDGDVAVSVGNDGAEGVGWRVRRVVRELAEVLEDRGGVDGAAVVPGWSLSFWTPPFVVTSCIGMPKKSVELRLAPPLPPA